MKDGIYAVYKGKEYEVGIKNDGTYTLRAYNILEVKNGFIPYRGIFVNNIQKDDLEDIYDIETYAEYQGYKFRVIKEDKNNLLLHSLINDYRINRKLGLDMVDKGLYQKWVNKSLITTLYEEKSLGLHNNEGK
ncbi:MAG: hypothetical protein K0R05_2667 [Anaerocolumna sp.]|jgi:hypothetical protein|nr:hypothetical protein [Anaerocolumna sp.]